MSPKAYVHFQRPSSATTLALLMRYVLNGITHTTRNVSCLLQVQNPTVQKLIIFVIPFQSIHPISILKRLPDSRVQRLPHNFSQVMTDLSEIIQLIGDYFFRPFPEGAALLIPVFLRRRKRPLGMRECERGSEETEADK